MNISELPQRLAARVKDKRRGLDRVFARKVADTTSRLVAEVSAEQAKREANAERAATANRVGQ